MYLIPSSFGRYLSRFQSKRTQTQLPTYNQSESTLFDHLPESEKKAALAKLHDLAAQQPGQQQIPPTRQPRFFRWYVAPSLALIHN
jgi:hypothetical protein